jgi:hypothetical protein
MCILTRSQEIAIFSILLWGIKDAITKRRSKSYGIVKIAVVANPSIDGRWKIMAVGRRPHGIPGSANRCHSNTKMS